MSISAQFYHMPERHERVLVCWHCPKVKGHAELKIEKPRVKTLSYDFPKLHHSKTNSFCANAHLRQSFWKTVKVTKRSCDVTPRSKYQKSRKRERRERGERERGQKHRAKQNVSPHSGGYVIMLSSSTLKTNLTTILILTFDLCIDKTIAVTFPYNLYLLLEDVSIVVVICTHAMCVFPLILP